METGESVKNSERRSIAPSGFAFALICLNLSLDGAFIHKAPQILSLR